MSSRVVGWILFVALTAAALVGAASSRAQYDLVIRNGTIIDGAGNPGYVADIGVSKGKITAIGFKLGPGKKEFDAKGLVVAPGFIDVHTHAENVEELPNAENFVRMGVTTLVVGNCGSSTLDVGAFLERLAKRPVSVNIATLIGHNDIRRAAMKGAFNRPPTPAEMETMKSAVLKAMDDGAVGLSTGLIYLPGTFAQSDEIVELARVAGDRGGLYASHMRNESTNIEAAIDELLDVAKRAGCRAELSHIKLGGEKMWGKADQILAKLDQARKAGIEVTQDQYMYDASSTSLSVLLPDEFLEGGQEAFKQRLTAPDATQKISEAMKATLNRRGGSDYAYAVIANCNAHKELNGLNLVQAAEKLLGRQSLDDQIELVIRLQKEGGASCVFHGMSEADVETFLKAPNTMIASDASCRKLGEDVPHPRGYGNNARALARFVRERGSIRLEDAIRKMTSLPAQTFRLYDRGSISIGKAADITIFDPATVNDPSTYASPHHYATGFARVYVNGVAVVEGDKHTQARPGRPLRGPGWRGGGARRP